MQDLSLVYANTALPASVVSEMMPLAMHQPWLSPQSILNWPLLLDVDQPSSREWEKRIGTE
jgi:hypothetical protein